ncbi:DUF2167 domain-containing protein [Microbulbifer agarilyticus]|uniref:DUF2167 domain-containing protein n=1 Tax=Microbulbifer agarilyticus TaxID=260552 RepID=UPI001C94C6D6|nr:DUF2167 domain-containing protein [Microbulbifer agarilyticus]MBY6211878.1 DUF2167 domain-containing protein [Microbulbifer agarilyticus]MCA0893097.1 DUF2167 domain-containing protein [Microbulbifer agarilyticus]
MTFSRIAGIAGLIFTLLPIGAMAQAVEETAEPQLSEEQQQYLAWAQETWDGIERISGTVELPGGVASLEVPESFYYLNPQDSKVVLEEIWGNPESELTMGMLFPVGSTPFDGDSWGVTIEYSEEGYIRDDDAADIDYSDLLQDMKASTREESKYRVENGYESISLVGWAEAPYYDTEQKKLYWAKELTFGDMDTNTLNYNIRVLGRKGVLVLNFIAGMTELEDIKQNRDTVLSMASFNPGYKYEEFDPEVDKVAAYGLGALVAGKALAKTGVLAGLLLFLKKFWVLIPLAFGALFKLFRRGGKSGE